MWIKIEHLKEHIKGREMFVVRAFGIVPEGRSKIYTSDPYCTWWEGGHCVKPFPRWPHPFMPTHFCLLPVERER